MTVLDAGSRNLVVTYPNEVLYDAAAECCAPMSDACRWSSREDPTDVLSAIWDARR